MGEADIPNDPRLSSKSQEGRGLLRRLKETLFPSGIPPETETEPEKPKAREWKQPRPPTPSASEHPAQSKPPDNRGKTPYVRSELTKPISRQVPAVPAVDLRPERGEGARYEVIGPKTNTERQDFGQEVRDKVGKPHIMVATTANTGRGTENQDDLRVIFDRQNPNILGIEVADGVSQGYKSAEAAHAAVASLTGVFERLTSGSKWESRYSPGNAVLIKSNEQAFSLGVGEEIGLTQAVAAVGIRNRSPLNSDVYDFELDWTGDPVIFGLRYDEKNKLVFEQLNKPMVDDKGDITTALGKVSKLEPGTDTSRIYLKGNDTRYEYLMFASDGILPHKDWWLPEMLDKYLSNKISLDDFRDILNTRNKELAGSGGYADDVSMALVSLHPAVETRSEQNVPVDTLRKPTTLSMPRAESYTERKPDGYKLITPEDRINFFSYETEDKDGNPVITAITLKGESNKGFNQDNLTIAFDSQMRVGVLVTDGESQGGKDPAETSLRLRNIFERLRKGGNVGVEGARSRDVLTDQEQENAVVGLSVKNRKSGKEIVDLAWTGGALVYEVTVSPDTGQVDIKALNKPTSTSEGQGNSLQKEYYLPFTSRPATYLMYATDGVIPHLSTLKRLLSRYFSKQGTLYSLVYTLFDNNRALITEGEKSDDMTIVLTAV